MRLVQTADAPTLIGRVLSRHATDSSNNPQVIGSVLLGRQASADAQSSVVIHPSGCLSAGFVAERVLPKHSGIIA